MNKRNFVREIRANLTALGVGKGERMELNETVSTQKITIGDRVINNEIRVKSVSNSGVFLEWYSNGVRQGYSGEYPYNNKNVDEMTAFNIARILSRRIQAIA